MSLSLNYRFPSSLKLMRNYGQCLLQFTLSMQICAKGCVHLMVKTCRSAAPTMQGSILLLQAADHSHRLKNMIANLKNRTFKTT